MTPFRRVAFMGIGLINGSLALAMRRGSAVGEIVAFARGAETRAKALELGGACEGLPGVRGGGLYLCYFRDLDGNKLAGFSTSRT